MARKIPISGLPLLAYKLRTEGLPWLFARLKREWQMPTTGAGQALFRVARALTGGGRSAAAAIDRDRLYAFYDLAVAPLTFDFLWFLVGAELRRKRDGLAAIAVVIVPGREEGLRREDPAYERFADRAARRARIANILVPACGFVPAIAGVSVAGSRESAARLARAEGASVFPARYEPDLPSYPDPREPLRAAREEGAKIGVLRAAPGDLRSIERWLAARRCSGRVVTITLRHYEYGAARNSNLAAWVEFARRLDRSRYSVVFVPDTEQVYGGLPPELAPFTVCAEAAVNLGLRMALYEAAWLNLGVNNGPMGLCWLDDRTRSITFKILTEGVEQTTVEYMKHLGFEIGRSLPGSTPFQKWVWEDDRLEVIEREFGAMVAAIEAAG